MSRAKDEKTFTLTFAKNLLSTFAGLYDAK